MRTRRWVLQFGRMQSFTQNGRYHWRARARLTKGWRDTAYVMAKQARVPKLKRARIFLVYWPSQERERDPGNWTPSSKAAIDGIVLAGVVPNDSPEFVEELMPLIMPAKDAKAAGKAGTYELVIEDTDDVR